MDIALINEDASKQLREDKRYILLSKWLTDNGAKSPLVMLFIR
jgi:hypothetical protein